ncbi:hypothetical protein TI03_06360, partial [Achromatium sp. WMS1]
SSPLIASRNDAFLGTPRCAFNLAAVSPNKGLYSPLVHWQQNPNIGRAEALRRAQMYVLDNPKEPYYTHPASWAPFVVAGEGGVGQ